MSGAERQTPPTADVGRGALWLTIANLWHGVTGFLIYVAAARLMTPDDFGTLCVVMAAALAIEVLLIQGLPKGLARGLPILMEHLPAAAAAWIRRMLGASYKFALALFALCFLAAGPLARAMGDASLTLLFRVAALDLLAFAGFVILAAVFNGLHQYGRQAAVMAQYSTVKLVAVLGLLFWQPTPLAGIAGYVAGSLLGTMIAFCWSAVARRRLRAILSDWEASALASKPERCLSPRAIFVGGRIEKIALESREALLRETDSFHRAAVRFVVPIAAFAVAIAIYINLDLLLAKALFPGRDAGFYAGAAQVARMVYFVFLSFSEALYPAVSQAVARRDKALSAYQILKTNRLLLLLILPAVGLGMGLAEPTLALLFGADFAVAGPVLRPLLFGAAMLVFAQVLAAALIAKGHPTVAFGGIAVIIGLFAAVVFLLFGGGVEIESEIPFWMGRLAMYAGLVPSVAVLLMIALVYRLVSPRLRFPLLELAAGATAAVFLALYAPHWAPQGWLLIPYGALLMSLALATLSPLMLRAFRASPSDSQYPD